MTDSENLYGVPGLTDADVLNTRVAEALEAGEAKSRYEVQGVLTGQVDVKSAPIAMERQCCPGAGTMAHVRGCVNHPEYGSE